MVESLRLEFDLTPKDMEKVQEEVLERKIRRVGKWFCLTFVGVGMAFGVISTYLREAPAERPFMVAFVLTVVAVVLAFQWYLSDHAVVGAWYACGNQQLLRSAAA